MSSWGAAMGPAPSGALPTSFSIEAGGWDEMAPQTTDGSLSNFVQYNMTVRVDLSRIDGFGHIDSIGTRVPLYTTRGLTEHLVGDVRSLNRALCALRTFIRSPEDFRKCFNYAGVVLQPPANTNIQQLAFFLRAQITLLDVYSGADTTDLTARGAAIDAKLTGIRGGTHLQLALKKVAYNQALHGDGYASDRLRKYIADKGLPEVQGAADMIQIVPVACTARIDTATVIGSVCQTKVVTSPELSYPNMECRVNPVRGPVQSFTGFLRQPTSSVRPWYLRTEIAPDAEP